jgi:hypothetical protein
MRKKKDKGFRKELILPLFIVFILVMSMFGYMFGSSRTRLTYNGFKFYSMEDGGFILRLEDERTAFNYYPAELEWVRAPKGLGNPFNVPMIYVTSNYTALYGETISQVKFNLAQNLWELKEVYVQNAFTTETEYELPVITCRNATASVPVINFEKSNSTEISYENYCVTVKFRNREEIAAAYERLLYSAFGVME